MDKGKRIQDDKQPPSDPEARNKLAKENPMEELSEKERRRIALNTLSREKRVKSSPHHTLNISLICDIPHNNMFLVAGSVSVRAKKDVLKMLKHMESQYGLQGSTIIKMDFRRVEYYLKPGFVTWDRKGEDSGFDGIVYRLQKGDNVLFFHEGEVLCGNENILSMLLERLRKVCPALHEDCKIIQVTPSGSQKVVYPDQAGSSSRGSTLSCLPVCKGSK